MFTVINDEVKKDVISDIKFFLMRSAGNDNKTKVDLIVELLGCVDVLLNLGKIGKSSKRLFRMCLWHNC
jgi:hypothetical protein